MLKKWIHIIVIFSFIAIFYFLNSFYVVENYFTDILLNNEDQVHPQLTIVAIDDQSLEAVGQWPWPRSVVAQVTKDLLDNGAKAVFVDVMYSEQSQPEEDQAWQELVHAYDNLFLPVNFVLAPRQKTEQSLDIQHVNWPIYDMPKEQIGHINTMPDKDRVVRQIPLGIRDQAGQITPAMSVRLANMLLPESERITWTEDNRWYRGDQLLPTNQRSQIYFSYFTAPNNPLFQTISIQHLIEGTIDPAFFEDEVIFIGPYTVGIQDLYYTPKSRTLQMYGVEIHANIVQSFLDNAMYKHVSKAVGLILIALLTITAYFTFQWLNAKWSVLAYIAFLISHIVLFLISFGFFSAVLPLIYPILAITIAYIASIVAQYLAERKERGRVTGLFGRYLSKGVVDEILASDEEVRLGGERKDVSLVFVDIRGFTPLSESMEPEEVIQILNEYLDLCTRAVFEYEGTLDKFMGDGVMSFFGAPVPQEDHAIRAVRAALRMKEGSEALAKRLLETYGKTVSFGVGINSGPAVIGNIGSKDRLDYTAIGDTVNLAARLESNAKPGQILISEGTYALVKEHFMITPLDPIKVKGKEKLVQIYQVEENVS